MTGWKGWLAPILIVLLILQVLLFWPRAESAPEPKPLTVEEYDEYIRLMQERNEIMRKLIELEEFKLKLKTGKAWSA